MQRSALCRSRRELSNAYLLSKIGVDTAANEPLEVWGKIQFIFHLRPYSLPRVGAARRGAEDRETNVGFSTSYAWKPEMSGYATEKKYDGLAVRYAFRRCLQVSADGIA